MAPKPKVWKARLITPEGNHTTLVRARTKAKATAHVVLKHVEIGEATHDDAVAFGTAGGRIEEAIDE